MNHRARLPFQERKAPPRSFSPPVFYRPERRDLPERRKTERGEGKRQRQQRTSEQQLNPCDDDARAPPPSPQRNGDERRLRARVPPTVSCDESGRAGRGPERSQRRRRHRMRGVNHNNPFITGEPACANRFTRVRKHPISHPHHTSVRPFSVPAFHYGRPNSTPAGRRPVGTDRPRRHERRRRRLPDGVSAIRGLGCRRDENRSFYCAETSESGRDGGREGTTRG